ncbi:MAG: hypothetical protein AAFN80_16105 [Pseudomonadota bacterium]
MVWIAISVSVVSLLWIAQQNPKRRRVLELPMAETKTDTRPAWLVFAAPFVWLLVFGTPADVVNWMGGVCSFGWMLVAITPKSWARARNWLDDQGQKFEAACFRGFR